MYIYSPYICIILISHSAQANKRNIFYMCISPHINILYDIFFIIIHYTFFYIYITLYMVFYFKFDVYYTLPPTIISILYIYIYIYIVTHFSPCVLIDSILELTY